jgi:hypothetical protein|tara:strand:+ start:243 stop:431 length:189 start_codon:yes stop_codon:yes gene_type:complete
MRKFFKITARDTRIHKPKGFVLTFWLGADSKKEALKICKERGIIDIESIEDDTLTHPWVKEQ